MIDKYTIKLEVFEGPLDLLLHLIEKHKIDINDIPIAELTEQYLAYLRRFEEFNMEVASEFLLMAATLLQIKSAILLPSNKKDIEDKVIVDPRQELVERLLEYQRYKELSQMLEQRQEGHLFYRESTLPLKREYALPHDDIEKLWRSFQIIWEAHQEWEHSKIIQREPYTVGDKIKYILYLLEEKKERYILFTEVFAEDEGRSSLIASFLAILELLKLQKIAIRQEENFSPIYIFLRDEA